jgi:hypothetical protein
MQPALKKRWQIATRIPEDIERLFLDYHPVQRQLLYNRQVFAIWIWPVSSSHRVARCMIRF